MSSQSIAVVTGASSGIGAATARRLAAEGFVVVVAARRVERLHALVKEIEAAGGSAVAVALDVTSDESVAGLAEAVRVLSQPVTLLVNNAGGAYGTDHVEAAGLVVYEGGGGYTAAKHAELAVAGTLRLELNGRPVRVVEIDPGMVRTEEFALVRYGGDAERADAVYRGVPDPLTADDIADCVAWCATRPHHVNVDRLVVRPLAQAAQHKVHRVE